MCSPQAQHWITLNAEIKVVAERLSLALPQDERPKLVKLADEFCHANKSLHALVNFKAGALALCTQYLPDFVPRLSAWCDAFAAHRWVEQRESAERQRAGENFFSGRGRGERG
jgi:hypothetical protein